MIILTQKGYDNDTLADGLVEQLEECANEIWHGCDKCPVRKECVQLWDTRVADTIYHSLKPFDVGKKFTILYLFV